MHMVYRGLPRQGHRQAGRNQPAALCVHPQGAGVAQEGKEGGSHLFARVAQGQGQLRGDGAFPNTPLS